ncbi:Type II secretion system protein F [Aquisphaera giovannonii]|uniref:Type II secretion system protein F n=1 Tax=Aquisphaera giovannonii TaxID=406548 RepID=A0A5B9W9B6_9BACT|nr:type II secretion system F family protein [Aquisphaera giovannonii]QEH37027.1 Type II secretion system protein F [Aquisphaera giovannonii]
MSDVWEVDEGEEPQGVPAPRRQDKPAAEQLDEELDLLPSPPPSMRIWQMMGLVALVAVALALALAIGFRALPLVIFGGFLSLIAGAIAMGVVASGKRLSRQDALLSIMAVAAERGMPMPLTIAALADQYSGIGRRRILDLAASLHGGRSLPEALEASPGLVSKDAVLLAYVGQQTGRVPEALRMAASARASQMPAWVGVVARLTYFLAMLLVIETITGFILYYIVPRMEVIFKDFGVPLPGITLFVIGVSHLIIEYFYLLSPLLLLNILLLLYLPYSFSGWFDYDVPFFDRLLRRRHAALILRALSLSVGSKTPIEQAMGTLANHYPAWWMRRKLVAAEMEVQHGGPWIDALVRRGIVRRGEAELLQSATRVGNLAWAMREVADAGDRRTARRLQVVIQTLFPAVVLGLGVLVFFITAAFFIPLVTLIERLAEV